MISRARLFCGYGDNINETTATVGVWERFPFPSTGITKWRDEGKLYKVEVSDTMTRFTWNGPPTWFKLDATCNILKGAGANIIRSVEFVWYKNGVAFGLVRSTYMNNTDPNFIISGSGMVYLSTGDYLEPWIRNIENSDKVLLENCSFIFWEDSGY